MRTCPERNDFRIPKLILYYTVRSPVYINKLKMTYLLLFLALFGKMVHLKLYNSSFSSPADRKIDIFAKYHHPTVEFHDLTAVYQIRLMDSNEKIGRTL